MLTMLLVLCLTPGQVHFLSHKNLMTGFLHCSSGPDGSFDSFGMSQIAMSIVLLVNQSLKTLLNGITAAETHNQEF